MSCDICCETYTKSIRKDVKCEYSDCGFSCCKVCVRTYLIGTTADPSCMQCKKPWSLKFMVESLNRSFCDKEYKVHRKTLLMERELSKLPETMAIAEKHIQADEEEKKLIGLSCEAKAMRAQIALIKVKRVELIKQEAVLNTQLYNIINQCNIIRNTIYRLRSGTEPVVSERQKFIMACPHSDCRGYLSTQYKCELCKQFTCPDCHEIIGDTKTQDHTCNPDSVASAEAIKKETKGCPKCGVRIFKISGCDQMWCTACNVAFKYSTGKVDTGTVHNPHYFAHIATLNLGAVPRNPLDIVCGGLIDSSVITNNPKFIRCFPAPNSKKLLTDIHQFMADMTHNRLVDIRQAVQALVNGQDVRIDYIKGKIDKATMGDIMYRRDVKRKKQAELLHIYELCSVVGIETYAMCADPASLALSDQAYIELVDEKLNVLENLRKYCNDEFAKISITYKLSTMWIPADWATGKRKRYWVADAPVEVVPVPVPV